MEVFQNLSQKYSPFWVRLAIDITQTKVFNAASSCGANTTDYDQYTLNDGPSCLARVETSGAKYERSFLIGGSANISSHKS